MSARLSAVAEPRCKVEVPLVVTPLTSVDALMLWFDEVQALAARSCSGKVVVHATAEVES